MGSMGAEYHVEPLQITFFDRLLMWISPAARRDYNSVEVLTGRANEVLDSAGFLIADINSKVDTAAIDRELREQIENDPLSQMLVYKSIKSRR